MASWVHTDIKRAKLQSRVRMVVRVVRVVRVVVRVVSPTAGRSLGGPSQPIPAGEKENVLAGGGDDAEVGSRGGEKGEGGG